MKMAVLYHSKTGNTKKMAEEIVSGMLTIDGVEAKAFLLEEAEVDFVKECKCVILGTPVYVASMSGKVKSWLDGPGMRFPLAGKIGGAFATADYLHGGADIAIQSILSHLMVMGMLTYSGGGALGLPVIHLGPVALSGNLDESKAVFHLYGERMARKTLEIFQ